MKIKQIIILIGILILGSSCNRAFLKNEKDASLVVNVTTPMGLNIPFGSVSTAVITITNISSQAVTGITSSGLEDPFSIVSTTCSSTLAINSSCTYSIQFTSPGDINANDSLVLSYNGGFVSQDFTSSGLSVILNVDPVYAGNSNWMDHIKNDEPAKDWYSQSNDACDGSEIGVHSVCIHSGEKFKIELGSVSSCSQLSAKDSLQVFNWECKVVSGQAIFFSQGLKEGKGLKDLVDFSNDEFYSNTVTIEKTIRGLKYSSVQTNSAKWHTNPVVDIALDPSNSVNLTTSGTIYTVDIVGSETRSLNIQNLNKIAVVIKEGVELRDSADGDALVQFINSSFCWLEGSFNGDYNTAEMLRLNNTKFTKLINVRGRNTNSATLVVFGADSYGNLVYNFRSQETDISDESVWLDTDSNNNIYSKMMIVGAGDYGALLLYGNGVNNNIVSDVVISASQTVGIWVRDTTGSNMNTFSHFTIINGADNSVEIDNGSQLTFNNFLISNNAESFYMRSDSNNGLFSNIAIANSGSVAIDLSSSTGHKFTNNLLVGSNAVTGCDAAGVAPGIDADCAKIGISDHALVDNLNTTASFIGPLSVDDSVNDEALSTEVFSALVDFYRFENWYRYWGLEGGIFPDPSQRGSCSGIDTCQIWDVSLKANDAQVLNRSNSGSLVNQAFVPSLACPAAVHGDKSITDQQTSSNTFLVNAQEIFNDSLGDDDGLCESNEACIYSPNFGAYQGHGDYKAAGTCLFINGAVQNVQMYSYPVNGY